MQEERSIEKLIRMMCDFNPRSESDLVRLAYEFAQKAHAGQQRMNGEEYITHALGTGYHLASMKMDDATIIAGILHDVPDETQYTIEQIRHEFGKEIGELVDGVGRLGKLKYRGKERYAENLRKMFVSIARDIRIVIIKFADRMHNLETLDALPNDKQKRIAREVIDIYAPIADRLGIGKVKTRLEDLAFPYLDPEIYRTVSAMVIPATQEKEAYLARIHDRIAHVLTEHGLQGYAILSRVKCIYSTYIKMQKKCSESLDGIYDLVAARIIVPTIADCYAALGIIHQYWKPLKGRIKDYIAQPKPNNYRSLHTTVFCEDGEIVEFQIRTPEMDREARYGIAAHWHYDEAQKQSARMTQKLDWLNEILKLQERTQGNDDEYLSSLKLDIFQNRIFVFTPKGDVLNLPENSTVVDFAYHIHSDIGRRCSGAYVNDVHVSLSTILQSGDVVEIIVEKNRKKPSSDWLRFVKTHVAKSHIKSQLKEVRS